jgi:membrane associated rhomboid family serine protease
MNEFFRKRKRGLFRFSITTILVIVNIICFVLFSALIYFNPNFLDYIALKPENIIKNFYFWTFFTSMFMHGGIFHLFANMLSFLFLGKFTERILGKKRFLIFYLLAGLFAGLMFVLISLIMKNYFNLPGDFNTYAVGASGALFGLIGLAMMLTPNLPVYLMFIPIPIKMKYAAPTMLILLWVISILGNVPIGNTAHFGGFIIGIFYGFYLKKKYKNKTRYINQYFSR